METREDQMLRAVCQFLAGTDEQKLSYLPVADPSTSYVYNECGDRTGNPLVFYCHAAHELLARQVGQHQGQLSEILMEIGSILAVLIEVGRRNPYVWHLDKETYPISGECDGLWSVLRRLASSVLEARGWPRTSPDVPFREVGWSGVRLSGFEGLGEAGPGEGGPESERAELNWQISTDPRPMLGLLREAASERKLRLFASACWRRVAHALDEDSMREGAAILERSADGADPGRLLADAHASADPKTRVLANSPHPASYAAANVLFYATSSDIRTALNYLSKSEEQASRHMSGNATRALGIQAETIRDIFGNPFRAEDVRLEWLAPEVRSLAEAMYQTGRFDRMPALARMLEGLGCTNMTILSHCSASSEHVRGCWVVDTILGKS